MLLLKSLHVTMLLCWCAGLCALPLVLARHDPEATQVRYGRLRRVSHGAYTHVITPAALLTIASGTGLLFLRAPFVPWFFLKLLFVSALVILHAWLGHRIVLMGEEADRESGPSLPLVMAAAVVLILAVLLVVLSKPVIAADWLPGFLVEPLDRQLFFEEVPS
jgi:protoporphyrinogen IX oxidase